MNRQYLTRKELLMQQTVMVLRRGASANGMPR